ncbi:Transcription initiation factor TFIID subunit 2 [Smittium culicis]|uniref:Transcription initiation factor TFIID subunit 2 n=1 Tax=Smittium culicis TaxID=133412 RepID=A0A1R1XLM9_9FUNG|nr:Transcription initiation factor TFIID subunit 2 [Smittium culicis]OMJ24513.1 Transcription initiation factor TFIID subunit 2 [Smittium culicis]
MPLFVVNHQTASLDFDFDSCLIKGITEIFIEPKTDQLKYIHLNCESPLVLAVTVNSIPSRFISNTIKDPSEHLNRLTFKYDLIKSTELEIEIPDEIKIVHSKNPSSDSTDKLSLTPLTIKIWYNLPAQDSGIVHISDLDSINPTPVFYLESNAHPGFSRRWLPCVDDLSERMTWDLRFIVPAKLKSQKDPNSKLYDTLVISSGELVGQAIHPKDSSKKIFNYVLSVATPACAIVFAIGGFDACIRLDDPEILDSDSSSLHNKHYNNFDQFNETKDYETEGDQNVDKLFGDFKSDDESVNNDYIPKKSSLPSIGGVFAFGIDDFKNEIIETTSFICDAIEFYNESIGPYPFTMYKIVFIDGLKIPLISGASITISSFDLLYPKDAIEPAYESRRKINLEIAHQWFGVYIIPEKWLCNADVNQKPISYIDQSCVLDNDEFIFLMLKSPIVLYMLDKRMVKRGASLGLMRVIPKIFVSAMSGDLGISNSLSTNSFLRLCRKVSGVNLKDFADQWIFGTGCPIFKFSYSFNRKKLVVELSMIQLSSNSFSTTPYSKSQVFTGQMTARVREADGTPYEHVLDITSNNQKFEVQFNTKYKRIRRNTKRFHLRQMAAAAEEISANAELLGNSVEVEDEVYSNIALFGAENEEEKNNWRVVEWGEDDEESLASSTFEWIRMDSDMEWACIIYFEQPDFMWAAQLQKDRDVVAQIEAVEALENLPSSAASTTLMRTIMDNRVYYRVRAEAALALSKFATPELNWIGLYHLVKIYKNRFCLPLFTKDSSEPSNGDEEDIDVSRLPKRNNFSNFSEYFTLKAIITALSNITGENGDIPISVKNILYNAAKYNDNGENQDKSSLEKAYQESSEFYEIIDRFRRLDALVPSYQNVITVSAIDSLHKLSLVSDGSPIVDPAFPISMKPSPKSASKYSLSNRNDIDHLSPLEETVNKDFSYESVKQEPAAKKIIDTSLPLALNDGSYAVTETPKSSVPPSIKLLLKTSKTDKPLTNKDSLISAMPKADLAETQNVLIREHISKPKNSIIPSNSKKSSFVKPGTISTSPSEDSSLHLCESNNTFEQIKKANVDSDAKIIKINLTSSLSGDKVAKTTKPEPTSGVDYKRMKKILKKVATHKCSGPFLHPVDPIADGCPDYFDLIKKPIDISTILKKIDSLSYYKFSDFESDMDLLFSNCYLFNPANTLVHEFGKSLEGYYKKVNMESEKLSVISKKMKPTIELTPAEIFKEGQSPKSLPSAIKTLPKKEIKMSEISHQALKESANKQNLPSNPIRISNVVIKKIKLKSKVTDRYLSNIGISSTSSTSDIPKVEFKAHKDISSIKVEKSSSMNKNKYTYMSNIYESMELNDAEKKSLSRILRKLQTHPSGLEFLQPVDPIKQQVPNYFEVVKKPMDLSTVESKLSSNKYKTKEMFFDDIKLIVKNCNLFNPEGSFVYEQGHQMFILFQSLWKKEINRIGRSFQPLDALTISSSTSVDRFSDKANSNYISLEHLSSKDSKSLKNEISMNSRVKSNDSGSKDFISLADIKGHLPVMNYSNVKKCRAILSKLLRKPNAAPFLTPVDPIKLGIPSYFDIVKHPMDLGTIKGYLSSNDYYKFVSDFISDVQLVFDNCFLFNPKDTWVYEWGKKMESTFHDLVKQEGWIDLV